MYMFKIISTDLNRFHSINVSFILNSIKFLPLGNIGDGSFLSTRKQLILEVLNIPRGPMLTVPHGDLFILEDTIGVLMKII